MADSGSDDEFTFYGTPIEEEEESKAGQHRKDVKDQAATRALPIWKQVRPRAAPPLGGCVLL